MSHLLKRNGCSNGDRPTIEGEVIPTLDAKIQSTLSWSTSVYRIDDLHIEPESGAGAFLCSFDLAKLDMESGKNQNSSNRTQLAIKAEGKEIALLSGFLGRQCSFGELKYTRLIKQSDLILEIRSLRAEISNLRQENENLYGALESLQRPKMIS